MTNFDILKQASEDVDNICHLVGQVAVTTSVRDPRLDFEDNALGTFNTLKAARLSGNNPIFIYATTSKVKGGRERGMAGVVIVEDETRY